MKKFMLFFIFLILFFSVSAVFADGNFTDLQMEINNAEETIEITQNYIYENSSDYGLHEGIIVNKTNFTIDGNGYTIDGAGQSRIFNIIGDNVTILNLNIINGFSEKNGGAILANDIICKNTTFINNVAKADGGSINCGDIDTKNCEFIANSAKNGAAIYFLDNAKIEGTVFKDSHNYTFGFIYGQGFGKFIVDNCSFLNSTSKYARNICQ